jgi:hypothetical protein
MKQLQWDKLPQQQAAKTLWSNEAAASKEKEWISKLQSDGVWEEMEEGFKAKQLVLTLVGAYMTRYPSFKVATDVFHTQLLGNELS